MSTVYILLPVHNRREITEKFIQCLLDQTYKNYHLVLIDDGSTDGTSDMVLEKLPNATVIKGNGNLWWAGSLQKGIEWLKNNNIQSDDIVLMINDDVVVDNSFIELGRRELMSLPNTILQAKIYCDKTRDVLDVGFVYDDKHLEFKPAKTGEKINCLTTNGLFIRYRDLVLIGDFFPRLLPHYLSDYEFTIRAFRKGFSLRVSSDAIVWWDKMTTGARSFNEVDFCLFWKGYFSNKSAMNPIYWTSFVFLVSESNNIPLNLFVIWKRAAALIYQYWISVLKHKFKK